MLSRRAGDAVGAGLLGLVAVGATVLYTGETFGFRDPTEGTVSIGLVNDAGETVRVAFCEDTKCAMPDHEQPVQPGATVGLRLSRNMSMPFLVWTEHAPTRECRVLDIGPDPQPTHALSDTRRCP